jgi:hypothetical protein
MRHFGQLNLNYRVHNKLQIIPTQIAHNAPAVRDIFLACARVFRGQGWQNAGRGRRGEYGECPGRLESGSATLKRAIFSLEKRYSIFHSRFLMLFEPMVIY